MRHYEGTIEATEGLLFSCGVKKKFLLTALGIYKLKLKNTKLSVLSCFNFMLITYSILEEINVFVSRG